LLEEFVFTKRKHWDQIGTAVTKGEDRTFILFAYLFWWDSGLKSPLDTCKAGTVLLHLCSHTSSPFLL
jgi:hypothetical protein